MPKNRERKDQRKAHAHVGRLGRGSLVAWAIVSALPASAWAQIEAQPRSGLGPKPPIAVAVAVAPITRDQVESFATVVGEDPYIVAQVLTYNPELIPAAVAATKAREERKRTGRGLIIGGFSVLGVGVGAGLLMALSGPLICFDEECKQRQQSASNRGEAIAIAGAALGLALAIPGFIKNAAESDTEREAIRRYRARHPESLPAPPREPARFPAVGYAPPSVNLSLLSAAF
jgi:hypothetical protein